MVHRHKCPAFGQTVYCMGVAKIGATEAFKKVWPFVGIYVACVIVVMLFPSISLFLPRLLGLA